MLNSTHPNKNLIVDTEHSYYFLTIMQNFNLPMYVEKQLEWNEENEKSKHILTGILEEDGV